MTTPRDDIAGLNERLRKRSAPSEYSTGDVLGEEAATQLDSLLKERDSLQARVENALHDKNNALRLQVMLEAEVEKLSASVKELEGQLRTVQNAAKTIASCQGTELEHLRQNKTFDHKLRAEHESLLTRDALMTEALEAAEARALRAEQERDEAYERLKPFAKGWWSHQNPKVKISAIFNHNPFDERVLCTVGEMQAAYSLVRRLAAGPEKEKKE